MRGDRRRRDRDRGFSIRGRRRRVDVGAGAAIGGTAVDPAVGAVDDTQEATAADQYAARHNPFVYFRSLIDVPSAETVSPCAAHVAPLTQLAIPSNGHGHLAHAARATSWAT